MAGLEVTIYAKPADAKTSGAYAQIGSNRGLVPLNLVREEKILSKASYTTAITEDFWAKSFEPQETSHTREEEVNNFT